MAVERFGSIKLLEPGEFLFEGGFPAKSGLPLFEGVVSFTPEEQTELAAILKRKGEREFLRVGSVDLAFYWKESGRCNLVVKDMAAGKLSWYPLGQLQQEELYRLVLISLRRQTVSLFLEGNVVVKEADSDSVEINGVVFEEEECYRLARALDVGSYYESWVNGVKQITVSVSGYSISGLYLSPVNSEKLHAVFESASLFFSPSFLSLERFKK